MLLIVFFFKQKTAYEMRISDWSSDVCSSDLTPAPGVVSPINGQMMLDRTAHKPPKCYMDCEQDVVDWIYEPLSEADRVRIFANKAKSLDWTILDLADDIAYGVHTHEAAISLGPVSTNQSVANKPSYLNRES